MSKDDDSCSRLIISIKLSNIKCKPKDETKCVVKNDHSSSLIVSIKLSSIKLKRSNPKKDDVIFTDEELPNPDILLESYLVVQQHHCQMKEFLIVLLMSLVIGTVYFMPFHISLLCPFHSITIYVKQLLVICQTLKICLTL
uniref:Uncharacterized protein n=1 Tax=Amphimedon queenslandica TaxID=400682 RepID=A0A1X7U4M2_AMPQE